MARNPSHQIYQKLFLYSGYGNHCDIGMNKTVEKNVRIGKNDDDCRVLGSEEKGFVRTERSDTRNIIANKKPELLIRLKSLAAGAA